MIVCFCMVWIEADGLCIVGNCVIRPILFRVQDTTKMVSLSALGISAKNFIEIDAAILPVSLKSLSEKSGTR